MIIMGLTGLGVSTSYALAQQVVALLNANDHWSAVAVMSGLSPTELAEVVDKSIALGADPAAVRNIAATLAKTEVIEVESTAPKAKPGLKLWHLAVAVGVLGAWGYTYKLLRERGGQPAFAGARRR